MYRYLLASVLAISATTVEARPPTLKPVKPGVELVAGEALLVIAVDAGSLETDRVFLHDLEGGLAATLKLPTGRPGYRYHLFAVKQGEYRIGLVRLPKVRGKPFEYPSDTVLRVEPGRVNYFGEFTFTYGRAGMDARVRDRTGRLITSLRESHPGLQDRYPVIYMGEGDADWSRVIQ